MNKTSSALTGLKYWAFISYSHRDKAWGDWLHKGLERYKIPKSLAGRETERGEPVPARIFPVFRDREELPTAVDLGEIINRALEQSRYLIVICSPASARSQWVNQEIIEFKRLGGENRVLAIIVEGEPNASCGKPGFTKDQECFPEALRYKLGTDGQLSQEPTEPIAADARHHADGKSNALLKLVAGVLGVNYDDLKRRDEVLRRQRQRVAMATISMIALMVGGLAIAAVIQRNAALEQKLRADNNAKEAEEQRREAVIQKDLAERNMAESLAQQGGNYLNLARASFRAMRPTEAHRQVSLALAGMPLSSGGTRPFFAADSAQMKASLLMEKMTRGLLSYQKSAEPFDVFFSSVAHDAIDRRLYGSHKSEVRAYALENNRLIWKSELTEQEIVWLALTSDRAVVLAASKGKLALLDAATGRLMRTISLDMGKAMLLGGTVERVVYRLSNSELASVETTNGKIASQVKFPASFLSVQFAADGQSLLACDREGNVMRIDAVTLSHKVLGKVDFSQLTTADFSPDGKYLAVAGVDGKVSCFSVENEKCLKEWPAPSVPIAPVIAMECHGGSEVYMSDQRGFLTRLDSSGRTLLQQVPADFMPLLAVDVLHDQVLMVGVDRAESRRSNVMQASVDGSHTNFPFFGETQQQPLGAARCSHPSGKIVLYDQFGKIKARVIPTSQVFDIADLSGDDQPVDIACSADGNQLAILTHQGVLRYCRMGESDKFDVVQLDWGDQETRRLMPANRISFAADGKSIYVLTALGLIQVDTADGQQNIILPKEELITVSMIATGATQDRLYMATQQALIIYNLKTREIEQSLSYPGVQYFSDVGFDTEFVYVAAQRDDQGVLLILRRQDHSLIAELNGHQGYASSLMQLEDGRVALTGENDLTVWDLSAWRRKKHRVLAEELPSNGPYSPAPGGRLQMPNNNHGDTVSEIDPVTGSVLRKFDHYQLGAPGLQFMHYEFAGENNRAWAFSELPDQVHVFDRANFQLLTSFTVKTGVKQIVSAHSDSWLMVLSEEGACGSYDFKGQLRWIIPAPARKDDLPRNIELSADDRFMAVQKPNAQSAMLFATDTGKPVGELPVIAGIQLGKRYWVGLTRQDGLSCWRAVDQKVVWSSEHSGIAYVGCRLIESEGIVIAWDSSGIMHYLDMESGQLLLSDPRFPLNPLEQRVAAVGGLNNSVLILNHSFGECYWVRRFGPEARSWFGNAGKMTTSASK